MELPCGLTNLGNTCYMNATVQCLRSVPELKTALRRCVFLDTFGADCFLSVRSWDNSLSLQRWLLCECSLTATSLLFDLPLGILVPCDLQEQMHHHSISQQVLAVANLKCIHLLRLDAFELIELLFASSALRDLYETMEKTSSSLPPIILLQFLHMAFPQFAEKGDQGQYLQQVKNATNLRTFLAFTSLSKCVQCNCLVRALACFVPSGCQRVLAANGESASTKIGATWVRDADGGNYSRPVFPTRCRLPMKLRLN